MIDPAVPVPRWPLTDAGMVVGTPRFLPPEQIAEGEEKLRNPHELESPAIAIGILFLVAIGCGIYIAVG